MDERGTGTDGLDAYEVGPSALDPDPFGPGPGFIGTVHGADEPELWQSQQVTGLCAPTSVAMVLEDCTGAAADKDAVAYAAAQYGLLSGGPDG